MTAFWSRGYHRLRHVTMPDEVRRWAMKRRPILLYFLCIGNIMNAIMIILGQLSLSSLQD